MNIESTSTENANLLSTATTNINQSLLESNKFQDDSNFEQTESNKRESETHLVERSEIDDRIQQSAASSSATATSTTTTTTTVTTTTTTTHNDDASASSNDFLTQHINNDIKATNCESGTVANKAIINIAPSPADPPNLSASQANELLKTKESSNSILVNTVRSSSGSLESEQDTSRIQVVHSSQEPSGHHHPKPFARSSTQKITSPPPLPPSSDVSSRGVHVQRINVGGRVDDNQSASHSNATSVNRISVARNDNNSRSINAIYTSMMDDDDVMYNSLRRLSNMTAMSTQRLKKITPTPIPFRDSKKELTFTLNEAIYTHGDLTKLGERSLSHSELLNDKINKKNIYKRLIRSIGTSLDNCVASDMISIDIEPESTKLPMMCKLMIIVEGAAYERGTRVLVRDASIQVGAEDESNRLKALENENSGRVARNESSSSSETRVRIEKVRGNDDNMKASYIPITIQGEPGYQEKSIFIPTTFNNRFLFDSNSEHMCRHRSIESLNLDSLRNQGGTTITFNRSPRHSNRCQHYHQHRSSVQPLGSSISRIRIQNGGGNSSRLCRNMCGGSLNSLTSTSSSASSSSQPFSIQINDETSSNYFNKKKRHSHVQSHLDMNEYTSIPYYQYQRKDLQKKDFCSDTTELHQYCYSSSSRSNSSYTCNSNSGGHSRVKVNVNNNDLHDGEEIVEVNIPIGIMPQELHRNEKHIMITHGCGNGTNDYASSFSDRMRRYIDERINKFEAEITFYNIDENTRASNPIISFKQPSSCNGHVHLGGYSNNLNHRYHHHHSHMAEHPSLSYTYHYESQNTTGNAFKKTEPSVTHLMLMQVVDGRILDQ